jgi:hypothetical protein
MKTILITILFSVINIVSFAQCNITTTKSGSDIAHYANAENIYKNSDIENGLLAAYFQLVVIQNNENKDLLKFAFITKVLSKRPKATLVPRKITFFFEDNIKFDFLAADVSVTNPIIGVTQNQCNYGISLEQYKKFQSSKIEGILIEDTRTGEQITTSPFKGLIQEQANCIANKL